MAKTLIQYILLYIVLVLLQALVFNRICIFNVAVPYIFILFIIRLPVSLSINALLSVSFAIGLTVDIFSDTLGMNALSCTLLGLLRKPILSLYMPREDDVEGLIPTMRNIGFPVFLKYAFSVSLVYCIIISAVQMLTFSASAILLLRMVGSTILTSLIIWGIECLINSGSAQRL